MLLDRHMGRIRRFVDAAPTYPPQWQVAARGHTSILHLTAAETAEVAARMPEVAERFRTRWAGRTEHPDERPEGTLPVETRSTACAPRRRAAAGGCVSVRLLLRHRDARRYLSAQALSLLGDSAMWLACGIWVKTLTGSDTAAALTFLCFTAPAVLAPLLGLLVDRVRRAPLLIAANLAGAAMLVPLLFVNGRGDVWLIYLVMFLHRELNMLIAPAQSALLVTLLPAEVRMDANAALRTIQEGLRVLAPLAGAGLFGLLGGHAVALLDMGTFVIAAALVASLRNAESKTGNETGSRTDSQTAVKGIGAGFRFIAATSQLRRLTVASAVATLAVGLGGSTLYAVIGLGLHRSPQFAGVTQMVQGVGAIAGGLSAAAAIRRLGEIRTTVVALVVFAASPLLMAAPSMPVVLAGNAVAGAALPWIVIAIITLLQRLAPLRLQGRVYAAFEVCATGPQTAGLAAGAALLTVLDYRVILAAESTVLLLAAALLARARPIGGRPRSRRPHHGSRAVARSTTASSSARLAPEAACTAMPSATVST